MSDVKPKEETFSEEKSTFLEVEVLYVSCDWTVDGTTMSFSAADYSFLFESLNEAHVMACDVIQRCVVGLYLG
ncbi:hypothetical protein F2Q69_00000355 [Brassica cretica]|uniref:Uncharacterized protein n=1 Tax=Brassica cretica TaxID=69181 RepID=A0A8S9NW33_BRACR|nr:hypothetical protein F2Q69_00000355 [Brassica cretica]